MKLKIIPFATSGGSGMGSISKNIKQLVNNSIVEDGKRFSINADEKELKDWAKNI